MYNILKNGQVMATVDTLETAINLVRSLEAHIDFMMNHSPYSLELNEEVSANAS